MRRIFIFTLISLFSFAIMSQLSTCCKATDGVKLEPSLSVEQLQQGWVQLFDGKTTYGWRALADSDTAFAVEDDHIALDKGTIYTTSQFGNFELSFQFKMSDDLAGTVRVRTSPVLDEKSYGGYAIVLDNLQNPERRIGSIDRDGNLSAAKEAVDFPVAGQWYTMNIAADGGKLSVKINGWDVASMEDAEPLGRGFIAIDVAKGALQLRNINLRPLGMKSLFNGKDLADWNEFPELSTKATVTPEGFLKLQGGSGMIETKDSYDDFNFQTEVNIQVPDINSGVFFRCIPGDKMNGYEAQLNNTINAETGEPGDCGTGGIFRRKDARAIIAKDQEWFFFTIHADDKHIATWVNGMQVCDWSDFREPDPNPRRGLRLEPGTIQLQGHDATTDVLFRNISAGVIPPRK